MKKILLALLSFAAVLTASAAPLTFDQIRCNTATQKQLAEIKSAKLIYQVFTEGEPAAKVVIRMQRPEKIRIDVISPADSYAVCHSNKSGWGYTKKDGFFDLTAEENAQMHLDADFLPIPIDDTPAFANPVAKGEEKADGVLCRRYETKALSGKPLKVTLWVEKSTSLLRKVEAEDAEGKTTSVYRDYKMIGGIKFATLIYVSDNDGFHRMSLQSATWNPVFAANLFTKPASADKLAVAVTKTPSTYHAAPAPARRATPNEIAALKKKISKLEILIQDDENKLAALEKIIGNDREQATALASVTTPVRYRSFWSRSGFIVHRSSNKSGKRTRHRMINKLNRETQKAMRSHAAISRELVRYRIQLADAKAQLEQISGK